ncbi:MAG TPA: transketolase [Polyangiaceae bacterium]|nr:transketolase [Polyangiaceae bacterium]
MPREYSPQQIQLAVSTIKGLSIDAVEKAKSGHPGTPMGLADITFEVFTRYLRYDPRDPAWLGRDRFVLSCGHASMLLYSMLHLAGYDLPLRELEAFRQWGSKTPGHPEHGLTPGVETTTGPLGQGVGNAVGMALALKLKQARFGDPYAGARVFCLASDGDLMEGVSAEASSIAGHLQLDNLIVIYDDNHITIEGDTALAYSDDACKRYESYGWFSQFVDDGHDHAKVRAAIDRALARKGQPSFIRARTHIGQGAPHKHDSKEAHGEPLGAEEVAATKKAMGFDPEKSFFVPAEVYALFKERAGDLALDHDAWNARFEAWRKADPERAARLDAFEKKSVPASLYDELLKAAPAKDDATRNLFGALEQVVAARVPSLIGGAADLAPSTKTLLKDGGAIGPGKFDGRNMHFGIREHGMGAVCNGMSVSGGIIPFGATFLIFSDYMRPSIRLSALMDAQCLWVYTHDSVFLGEDGPTHQSIEQLWALRLIPNLYVARPADALECAAAWAIALDRKGGPTAFALSRQKVPQIQRDAGFDPKNALRGAYVVQEAAGGKPDCVLVATGSELHLAVGARAKLEAAGKRVRVVSALCLEAFAAQDPAYRERVLPRSVRKASIEAGRSLPWRGIVGDEGLTIGIDRFGASAPDKDIAEHLGFTVDAVTEKVRAWMG